MSDLLWPLRIYHSIPTNPRGTLGSALEADGTFYVGTPGVLRDRPEIGYYKHDLGPERALDFREFVEQAGLWGLPDIDTLHPEQPHVHVMAGAWEGPKHSVMWSIDDLPAEVLPVMDVFTQLVDEASASPRAVLAGEARWCAPNFSAREPMRLEFTLRAKGTEDISLQNPMMLYEGASFLDLLVSPVPAPGSQQARPTRIAISPDSLAHPNQRRVKGPPAERVEMAPGQSVRFVATASAYLSPGEYRAVLLLDTGGGMNITSHVRGVLSMEMPLLRLVHR